jgi:anti-sigma B factor antagonist
MSDSSFRFESANDALGTVVRLGGEIDLNSAPAFRTSLLEFVAQRPQRVILDLANVTYIDSSGVGTIVEFKRRLERSGGRVILAALQARVKSVFEITRLDRFFIIVESLDEAQRK